MIAMVTQHTGYLLASITTRSNISIPHYWLFVWEGSTSNQWIPVKNVSNVKTSPCLHDIIINIPSNYTRSQWSLTHHSQDKMANILHTTFSIPFYCISLNLTEVYSQGYNWQYVSFSSDNGLAPNWLQALIWSNQWCSLLTSVSNELNRTDVPDCRKIKM